MVRAMVNRGLRLCSAALLVLAALVGADSRAQAAVAGLDGVIGGMDGGNVVFLGPDDGSRTFAVYPADDFAWAPSGDKLVVYAPGLWIVNADGTGRRLLTND